MNIANTLTAERAAQIKNRTIDLSDIPEITREQWATGHFRNQRLATLLDDDNKAWLQVSNAGYEIRLNFALRWAREHNCPIAGTV